MAKKSTSDGVGCVWGLIVLIALIVILFTGVAAYTAILVLPLAFFTLGWIVLFYKSMSLPQAKSTADFDLTESERKEAEQLRSDKDRLQAIVSDAYDRGKAISRRKDGRLSERSNLGKELNSILLDAESSLSTAQKKNDEIKGRPQRRMDRWLNLKSSFSARTFALIIYMVIIFLTWKWHLSIVDNIFNFVMYVPKILSDFATGILNEFGFFENIKNSWLFKPYQYYSYLHAPMVSASLVALVSNAIIKPIKKKGLKSKLNK